MEAECSPQNTVFWIKDKAMDIDQKYDKLHIDFILQHIIDRI
jgi:hypothetical protein